MPELPEVEVVKRSLNNKVQNLIIKEVKINDGRLRYRVDKKNIRKIIGLKLKKIDRTKFDIRYGSGQFFDNLGDNMIYDDFTVKFKVGAVKG